jgi:hypothetical protein
MTHILAQRKFHLGLRWAADAGKSFGLWAVIVWAALQLVQFGFRLAVDFEGDFSLYLLRFGPLVLTAVAWVHLVKTFPLAIATGMTRREYFAAYSVFSAVVVAGGVAYMAIVKVGYNLTGAEATGSLDLGGAALLETGIRAAVYFAAGSAAGAVMARSSSRNLGAVLAGVLIGVLLFRSIPFQLLISEFAEGVLFEVEFPGSEELLAPLDAVLTVVYVLIVWLALARASMPHRKA